MKNIFVEGHRGYGAKFPENTLMSYAGAMALGVDGFEFDIWLSADKVPVLMHDGNAFRTCGVNRHLRDMTLAEIKQMDAGFTQKFGDKYMGKGIQVPTLKELCELVHSTRPDPVLGVEIKEYTEECVDISVPILQEYGLFDAACFYAFDAPTIAYLKSKYHARTMGYPDFQMGRWFDGAYKYYDEIGTNMRIVSSEILPVYQAKKMPIHMYCADTAQDVALCLEKDGCELVTANDPVPLMRALGRFVPATVTSFGVTVETDA